MKPAQRRKQGRPALDLIEEAVHLLRTAPAGALAAYYLGALPFVLGLLFFWADMSTSAFARRHVAEAALGTALLFVWMKFWQAIFARRLRAFVSGVAPEPLDWGRGLQLLSGQAALQATGLFILPVATVTVLTLPWVYAFYQNLTALAESDAGTATALLRRAARQARLWPEQNILALLVLGSFTFFVFLNCCVGCGLLPQLLKLLFGLETVFSRGGTALLNTTFFAAMLALTYLCVDPLLKTYYILRCFYGDAIQSGADLRAELRLFSAKVARLAALLLIALALVQPAITRGAETAPVEPTAVSPDDLNRAIDDTIQQRKYTWRIPRERVPDEPARVGVLSQFLESIAEMLRDALKSVFDWLGNILRKIFGGRLWTGPIRGPNLGWVAYLEVLLYVLVAAVLCAIVVVVYRFWRNRQPLPDPVQTEALQPVPDLTDENLGADQLPEDGWMQLARELLTRGEFRLALRAFYLSSLAHLADRNLISLARFKSNRDYERELQRRAHSFPQLREVFGENVSAFDRVWYGTHEATNELVARFAANVERLKAGG